MPPLPKPSQDGFCERKTDTGSPPPQGAGVKRSRGSDQAAQVRKERGAGAQGGHGIKGAAHGIKGGRPQLDLSDAERAERRRKQQEDYRRRQGIPAKAKRTSSPKARPTNWLADYIAIWSKPPGVPLTKEEFAVREPLWNAWVEERQGG